MASENCSNELSALWPDDIYVTVGPSAIVKNDDQSVVIPTMAGWKTRMVRNNLPQWLGDPGDGDTYFDYTPITGEFTFSQKASTGERMIFMAYKPA